MLFRSARVGDLETRLQTEREGRDAALALLAADPEKEAMKARLDEMEAELARATAARDAAEDGEALRTVEEARQAL